MDEVSRGGDRDDHHKSWKVRCQTILIFIIIITGKKETNKRLLTA